MRVVLVLIIVAALVVTVIVGKVTGIFLLAPLGWVALAVLSYRERRAVSRVAE